MYISELGASIDTHNLEPSDKYALLVKSLRAKTVYYLIAACVITAISAIVAFLIWNDGRNHLTGYEGKQDTTLVNNPVDNSKTVNINTATPKDGNSAINKNKPSPGTSAGATTPVSQAKKPTIMVVPSDAWCKNNGYMTESVWNGKTIVLPDYKKAFQENTELLQVVAKINEIMAERGFPLKDMASAIKTLEQSKNENSEVYSKSGSGITETQLDKLKAIAKADIIMQLSWSLNVTGPKRSVTFVLQGIDSHTDKQIASAMGTGAPSFSAESTALLEEAVLAHMDHFSNSLQSYFDDLFVNGREITIRLNKFAAWPRNFEYEYKGKELGSIIEEWISQNTVKGQFNTTDSTDSMMLSEQVRIPLYDNTGKALDARGFLKQLQSVLKKQPYLIPCKLMTKGLGEAALILGNS